MQSSKQKMATLTKDDEEQLIRIEKTLKRKSLYSAAPIKIRDAFVTQYRSDKDDKGSLGEFSIANPFVDKEKAKTESWDSLFSRMITHIHKMTDPAALLHLHDNFNTKQDDDKTNPTLLRALALSQLHTKHPDFRKITKRDIQTKIRQLRHKPTPKMAADSTNHITRVLFNEFSFYPNASKGPIPKSELPKFIAMLEALAKAYPANLHILVSSLPVVDENKQVSNVVFYLQCGEMPVIDIHAKATVSRVDLLYEGTENRPSLQIDTPSSHYQNKLLDAKQAMISITQKNFSPAIIAKELCELRRLCMSIPGVLPEPGLMQAIDEFETMALAGKFGKDGRFGSFNLWYYNQPANLLNLLQYMIYSLGESKDQIRINSVPATVLSKDQRAGLNLNYGKQARCVTAGGVIYTTALDVCLDHAACIAIRQYKKDLDAQERKLEHKKPRQASHIVTSATIGLFKDTSITPTGIAHADSYPYRMGVVEPDPDSSALDFLEPVFKPSIKTSKAEHQIVYEQPAFGGYSYAEIHPLRQLEPLAGELDCQTARYNEVILKIQALQFYRVNHPELEDILSQRILAEIFKFIEKKFAAIGTTGSSKMDKKLSQYRDELKGLVTKPAWDANRSYRAGIQLVKKMETDALYSWYPFLLEQADLMKSMLDEEYRASQAFKVPFDLSEKFDSKEDQPRLHHYRRLGY